MARKKPKLPVWRIMSRTDGVTVQPMTSKSLRFDRSGVAAINFARKVILRRSEKVSSHGSCPHGMSRRSPSKPAKMLGGRVDIGTDLKKWASPL